MIRAVKHYSLNCFCNYWKLTCNYSYRVDFQCKQRKFNNLIWRADFFFLFIFVWKEGKQAACSTFLLLLFLPLVQQPKNTIHFLLINISTAMKMKVCAINLLHFLVSGTPVQFPTKECLTLKKKWLTTLWVKGRLVTRARGRCSCCASSHPAVPWTCQQQTAGS